MSTEKPGIPVVYSDFCAFCGGKFRMGERVMKAWGWDQLEHEECAGMGLRQMSDYLVEILSAGEDEQ